jgi:hypothetical protein
LQSWPAEEQTPLFSQTQCVWNNPDLVVEIGRWTRAQDLTRMSQVNQACAVALNTPNHWRRRFSPAIIDWPNRRIRTCVDWRQGFRPVQRPSAAQAPVSRFLRNYQGEPWRLTTDLTPPLRPQNLFAGSLHSVWQAIADDSVENVIPYPSLEQRLEQAYLFLIDRGFRLREGLPVATYREGSDIGALAFALTVGGGLATFSILVYGFIHQEETLPDCLAVLAPVAGFSCLIGGIMMSSGSSAANQNLLFGRLQRSFLDRMAREVNASAANATQAV